jgi:hypothetical protein
LTPQNQRNGARENCPNRKRGGLPKIIEIDQHQTPIENNISLKTKVVGGCIQKPETPVRLWDLARRRYRNQGFRLGIKRMPPLWKVTATTALEEDDRMETTAVEHTDDIWASTGLQSTH